MAQRVVVLEVQVVAELVGQALKRKFVFEATKIRISVPLHCFFNIAMILVVRLDRYHKGALGGQLRYRDKCSVQTH